jgi:hypothetical protein
MTATVIANHLPNQYQLSLTETAPHHIQSMIIALSEINFVLERFMVSFGAILNMAPFLLSPSSSRLSNMQEQLWRKRTRR